MRKLLPLAVVFGCLALLTVWREVRRAGSGAGEAPVYVRVAGSAFTLDDVTSVRVIAPGGSSPAFTVTRRGGEWLVDRPFRAPAAAAAVDRIVQALAQSEAEVRSEDPEALARFDLSPDRATQVLVDGADARILAHVAVGRPAGSGGTFVRLPSDSKGRDRTLLLGADLRAVLGLPAVAAEGEEPARPDVTQFHDPTLPIVDLSRADLAEVVAPGRRVVFRRGPAAWEVAEGGPGAAIRSDGVDAMLRAFAGGAQPRGLVDPARRAEVGLDTPGFRLTVTMPDGTRRGVFGAVTEAGGVAAFHLRLDLDRDPDVVHECDAQVFRAIFPEGRALFDLPPIDVDDSRLGRLVIERGGQRIAMHRPGNVPQAGWVLTEPALPLAPDPNRVEAPSAVLRAVRPVDWVDGMDAGETSILVRWGREEQSEDQLTTLRIGAAAPVGRGRLAVLPDRPARVLVLPDTLIERLAPKPFSLFGRKVVHDVDGRAVSGLRLQWAEGGETRIVRNATTLRWERGDGSPADTRLVEAAIAWLASVEVEAPAASTPVATCEVTIERPRGGPTVVEFALADGRLYVTRDGQTFRVESGAGLEPLEKLR